MVVAAAYDERAVRAVLGARGARLGVAAAALAVAEEVAGEETAERRAERLGRLADAARLVERAHAAGVIHRDLKPANFLEDEQGAVHLSDFGLAKLGGIEELAGQETMPQLTTSHIGMGTPRFMPPEQFEDAKRVDERVDVYSLGATVQRTVEEILVCRKHGGTKSISDKARFC